MKRFLALALLVCVCVSMAGCKVLDYKKAADFYEEGQYAQALEIYRALGDYADSAAMANICWQKADYEAAEGYFAAGAYDQALPLYEGLGMYSDSPIKAIRCRYEIGVAYLAAGEYALAIQWLEPLGGYEDCSDRINQARWLWVSQSRHTVVLKDDAESFRALSLEPQADGSLRILLENDSMLLGIPYETEFVMVIARNNPKTAYSVRYYSHGDTILEENAAGIAELPALGAGSALVPTSVSRIITHPDGTQTVSRTMGDTVMIRVVMAEVLPQVLEDLPVLLEKSGADITMKDLGF